MKLDFEKFIKDAKQIKLNKSEKDQILHHLKAVIVNQPVRKSDLAGHNIWSNTFSYIKLTLSKPMPIIIALVILLGGGTTFAAQSSLPGSPLYPVKVEVNERVGGWLSFSDQAKASWDAHLAEVRLQEAEKLAVENKLDKNTRISIEENFKQHAEGVANRVKKLELNNTTGALEVNSDFETSLKSHSKILDDIATSLDGSVKIELDNLNHEVKAKNNSTTENENKNEKDIKAASVGPDVQKAAEGKLKATQNKIDEVKKFIEKKKNVVDADTMAKAQAHLKLAETTLAQGKTKLEAGSYIDAFLLFQRAKNIAQETKLLLTAKADFEDDNDNPTPSPSPSGSVTPTPLVSPSHSPSPSPSVSATISPLILRIESNGHGKVRINLGF